MGIKSIKIVNLLSFDELIINDFMDINCIIGKNNAGKSNLLKLLRFFYSKLDGVRELPPSLNSSYSSYGSISIVYDTTRIKDIVTSKKNNSNFLKHIYNVLFKGEPKGFVRGFFDVGYKRKTTYELTLKVNSDDSTEWSIKDKSIRNILNFLYPFFEVETRHIDLYDWDKLWFIISKLKTFNVNKLQHDDVVKFFDTSISEDSKSYSDYVDKIDGIIDISKYSYREKVLNYIKVGMKGHTFMVSGEELTFQSDGTNSYKYIELLLTLLISLTRREYITPTIYIDEPETGLHPKRNEELIYRLYEVYKSFKKTKNEREIGKYKTPYPKILFSTHSPNILKYVIKLFDSTQQVLHFSKKNNSSTKVAKMNSQYDDKRFLNVFSDNEARLFFSDFILFVEGATELEVFGNLRLLDEFPVLKRIDVYQNDNVTLKYTNPSYANLSIPYLVLYDADKLIDFNVVNNKISYKNGAINVGDLYKKVSRSYCGSNGYDQKKHIKVIMENGEKNYSPDPKRIKFINPILRDTIASINKNILIPNNVMLNATTIEGSLINENSIHVFNQWIISEIVNNLTVKNTKDVSKFIDAHEKMYKSGVGIDIVFNGLFSMNGVVYPLTYKQSKFVKLIKYKLMNKIKNELKICCSSADDILILYRLVFDGKTDTLISMSNDSKKYIDPLFRAVVNDMKNKYLSSFGYVMGKSGGWVTMFIDYSLDYLRENFDEEYFENEFDYLFPELYGIISIASSSIE